ncbi:MAG: polysaccharide deacetylase family protein [Caulobacterales bacterium]
MTANRYADGRRAVVIHEDDVGMTHGCNVAFRELSAMGVCSAGSVMAPCPWFPEIAAMAVADPALDLGVHLTLNSEKRYYRWRPLTNPPRSAGLTDEAGYFWPDVRSVRKNAVPEAVEAELRAQIDAALAAGIDVTHLDAHMGAVVMPEFVDIYFRLGRDYDLPILLVKHWLTDAAATRQGEARASRYADVLAKAGGLGHPIFDHFLESPWDRTEDAASAYAAIFAGLPEGLSYLAFHFNAPGDFEVVEPEFAHIRIGEYELFRSGRIEPLLAEQGIEVIGMRQVRERMRAKSAAAGPA